MDWREQSRKVLDGAMKFVSPKDKEPVAKALQLFAEQETWNDVFSTKLFEMLDKVDGIHEELRDQSRSAAVLLEDATQALHRFEKLAKSVQGRLSATEQNLASAMHTIEAVERWSIVALSMTLIAVIWLTWIALRFPIGLALPAVLTGLIAAVAIMVAKARLETRIS